MNFDPSALFALGEAGAWYDPSDPATLWKDLAGTDPVAVDGDAVARIDDKSGNGNHLTQVTVSKRPLYRFDGGGKTYLLFDGVDDFLHCSFTAHLTQPFTRVSAIRQSSWVNGRNIFSGGNSSVGRMRQIGSLPQFHISASSGNASPTTTDLEVGETGIVTERWNRASSSLAVNAGAYANGDVNSIANCTGMTIGASNGGTLPSNIHFCGGVIVGRALTDEEIAGAREWMADKAGLRLQRRMARHSYWI